MSKVVRKMDLESAAEHGDLARMTSLHADGYIDVTSDDCSRAVDRACRYDRLEVLKYLHETCGYRWDTDDWMICYRSVRCLQYAHEHGCFIAHETLELASEEELFDSIIYLVKHVNIAPDVTTFQNVAISGDVPTFEFLYNRERTVAHENAVYIMCAGASAGQIDILKFCIDHGFVLGGKNIDDVLSQTIDVDVTDATNHHVKCLSFLLEHYGKVGPKTLHNLNYYCKHHFLDFDRYSSFRWLFKIVDTPHLNTNKHPHLYEQCKQRREEIRLQRQYALADAQGSIPDEVTKFVLAHYI